MLWTTLAYLKPYYHRWQLADLVCLDLIGRSRCNAALKHLKPQIVVSV